VLGARALPSLAVKFSVESICRPAAPERSSPGLPSWLKASEGTGVPVISSSTAYRICAFPEIRFSAASGPTCRSVNPMERSPLIPIASTCQPVGPINTMDWSSAGFNGRAPLSFFNNTAASSPVRSMILALLTTE